MSNSAATEAARIGLVLDCLDPVELARFWTAALGYEYLGAVDNYAMLIAPDQAAPKLLLQRVPEGKTTKNRMHLDIETPRLDDEVARLEGLGAKRLEKTARSEYGTHWIVMADPEGNEFCVCTGSPGTNT